MSFLGYSIEWVGLATAGLGACEYAIAYNSDANRRPFAGHFKWLRRLVRVWCGLGLLLLGVDLLWGRLSLVSNAGAPVVFGAAPIVEFVSPSWLSGLWLAVGVAFAVVTSSLLLRSSGTDAEVVPGRLGSTPPWAMAVHLIGALSLVVTLCGAHDMFVQLGFFRSFPLFPLPGVVAVVWGGFTEVQRLSAFRLALGETTRELESQRLQLERARELLIRQEALAALGELSAAVAHEVRNPLAVLKTAVAGLRNTRLAAADKKTLLSVLVEESGRLRELSEDLVGFAVAPNAVPAPCSSHAIVGAALEQVGTRGEQFEVDLDVAVDRVDCDEQLIVKALANLLRNAAQARRIGERAARPPMWEVDESSFKKAVPSPRWLFIRVISEERQGAMFTVFSVADRGTGMPADATIRAFEPFFSTKPRGTGLGLAIVRRIARAHGGDAEIVETGSTGTTVRFWIRAAQVRPA